MCLNIFIRNLLFKKKKKSIVDSLSILIERYSFEKNDSIINEISIEIEIPCRSYFKF